MHIYRYKYSKNSLNDRILTKQFSICNPINARNSDAKVPLLGIISKYMWQSCFRGYKKGYDVAKEYILWRKSGHFAQKWPFSMIRTTHIIIDFTPITPKLEDNSKISATDT